VLIGDLRKTIQVNSHVLNKEISFLDCKFVVDQNMARLFELYKNEYLIISKKIDSLDVPYRQMLAEKEKGFNHENYDKYYKIERMLSNLKSRIDEVKRNLKYIQQGSASSIRTLLQPDSTSFFVVHRNTTDKDARILLSKITIKNKKSLTTSWTTQLDNVFFDPSAAKETDAFKTVFSKGDPEFDFQFFDFVDNKLIVIYMLHAFALDINTGKKLWTFAF